MALLGSAPTTVGRSVVKRRGATRWCRSAKVVSRGALMPSHRSVARAHRSRAPLAGERSPSQKKSRRMDPGSGPLSEGGVGRRRPTVSRGRLIARSPHLSVPVPREVCAVVDVFGASRSPSWRAGHQPRAPGRRSPPPRRSPASLDGQILAIDPMMLPSHSAMASAGWVLDHRDAPACGWSGKGRRSVLRTASLRCNFRAGERVQPLPANS